MNKYNISPKAAEAAKLTLTCIIALVVITVMFVFLNWYKDYKGFDSPPPRVPVPVSSAGAGHITFDDLLDAIEWVESKGQANAYGDFIREYQAIGSFQLWKIYVDDVNRIAGTGYTYDDRLNRSCSREMARIYLNHYGGTFEEMARKHNGGPQGHNKKSTKKYWLKIKNYLDNLH